MSYTINGCLNLSKLPSPRCNKEHRIDVLLGGDAILESQHGDNKQRIVFITIDYL